MGYDRYAEEGVIGVVKALIAGYGWEFSPVNDNQVVFSVDGSWKDYSFTIAWSEADETLRLICTFPLIVPEGQISNLHDSLNRSNDSVWSGAFTWWAKESLMVWRYGLVLNSAPTVTTDQVGQIIYAAIAACERYYPAFQLVAGGNDTPEKAIDLAHMQHYGRA